jgi:tricorn protease
MSTYSKLRYSWLPHATFGFLLASLALIALPGGAAEDQARQGYYRFPTMHRDTIVFTAEGDLWRVPVQGGMAQRLTSHPGTESHAVFSPDGKLLAFSAEYEGPTEVYTMPSVGGLPTRRTFEGGTACRRGLDARREGALQHPAILDAAGLAVSHD